MLLYSSYLKSKLMSEAVNPQQIFANETSGMPAAVTTEQPRQFEAMESDYDVIGQIPNTDEILSCDTLTGLRAEISVLFGADGEAAGYTMLGCELGEAEQAEVMSVLMPTFRVVDGAYRRRTDRKLTLLNVNFTDKIVPSVEQQPLMETRDNRRPHSDGLTNHHVAAIGATTKVWKETFLVDPTATAEERNKFVARQIAARNIQPHSLASGDIALITPDTFHMSPEADPEVAGTRRVFMNLWTRPAQPKE